MNELNVGYLAHYHRVHVEFAVIKDGTAGYSQVYFFIFCLLRALT